MGQCTSKSSRGRRPHSINDAAMGLQAPETALDNLSWVATTAPKSKRGGSSGGASVVLIPEATEEEDGTEDETNAPVLRTVASSTRRWHFLRHQQPAPPNDTRDTNHHNDAPPPLISSMVSISNVLPDIEETMDDSEHQSGSLLDTPSDEESCRIPTRRRRHTTASRSNENISTAQEQQQQPPPPRQLPTPTLRKAAAAAARSQASGAALLGPLSPVKIKTAPCVQPSSICIRPPLLNTTATADAAASTINSMEAPPPPPPLHSNESTNVDNDADAQLLHYFGKLKLQVAVAEQQSLKRKVVAKLDDRVVDVTHHRNVWQQYQQIQQKVQVETNAANPCGATESALAEQDSPPPSPPPLPPAEKGVTKAATTPSSQTMQKASRRQRRRRGVAKEASLKDQTPKKSSETLSSTSRVSRRQRGTKSADSDASFHVPPTKSWLFDFDDEFQLAESAPPAAAPPRPNSDNWSLLSEASMAVQRRLYAEKQRQRQFKAAAAAATTTPTPVSSGLRDTSMLARDDTPVARNTGRTALHHGDDNLANMEVAFCSPAITATAATTSTAAAREATGAAATAKNVPYAEADNCSLVSDLDDSQSFSSLASNRYDYGVPRRQRRAAASRRQQDEIGGGAEHSSCLVSDDDYSVGGSQKGVNAVAEPVVFDFQSVLQRRLDIEARLRALIAMDDDHSNQAASDQVAVSSEEAVDHDDDLGLEEELGAFPKSAETTLVPASMTADGPRKGGEAFALSAIVSPLNRNATAASSNLCAQRSSDAERHLCSVTNDAFPASPPPPPPATCHGKTLNPAVVTPSVGREHLFQSRPTANFVRGTGGSCTAQTALQTNPTRVVSPENVSNNESFESTESPGFMTVPYLGVKQSLGRPKSFDETDSLLASPSLNGTDCSESNSRRNLHESFLESGLDEISMVANQSMSSEYGVPIHVESLECSLVHNDARGTRKTCVMEDAQDTLLLADQVETRVKDILHRYRNENAENRAGVTN
jgi:hypothetical protein